MFDLNKLSAIQVKLASPEKISDWSYGEVETPETINYRTQKPEPGGLFCEKIFGPSKDYHCFCGRYRRPRYAGKVCEKCGVEVTTKAVRRERMGHITLASPCTHIWYLKGTPSRIALLLDIPPKQLEEVVYFSSHIVLNKGTCKALEKCMVLNEKDARYTFISIMKDLLDEEVVEKGSQDEIRVKNLLYRLNIETEPVIFQECASLIQRYTGAEFGVGAEAIQRLLKEVDLQKEFDNIQAELKLTNSPKNQKRVKLLKRLEVVEAFRNSSNDPSWMVLNVLPVIPPDLRPMLPLDGGRYATSDLNDLYRKVISRNNRLKRLISIKAPSVITINEKRMLQEAVDALIDNGRRNKPVLGAGNRPLKSLSSSLKGKQGRFRQNLLGKRVDYSGRSVIAVGPTLHMDQCGIPREMAIQLFKPFICCKLMTIDKVAITHKQAESMIANNDERVFDAIEEIIKDHPVLLNRAPTLHRLGIQAFRPVLVEGRAIRLHPLVCTGFNADFDGDQMAVHVPLSKKAQKEAIDLMIANHNILGPKDGKPICIPSQDMLLGNYYITMENNIEGFKQQAKYYRGFNDEEEAQRYDMYARMEGKVFKDVDEVMLAYQTHQIHLQNRIAIRASSLNKSCFSDDMNKCYLITTPGKIIFNSIFPSDFPYVNFVDFKSGKDDKTIFANSARMCAERDFVKMGTNIKDVIASRPLNKPFGKKQIELFIGELFSRYKAEQTSHILDDIKHLGFEFSTVSGITVSIADISAETSNDDEPSPLADKHKWMADTEKLVDRYERQFEKGLLTDSERHAKVVKAWNDVSEKVTKALKELMDKENRNPVFMMSESGARGKLTNFVQLIGMRGLMTKPNGDAIEIPIKSCFRDGLSVSEFFIATHGARKGGADTALKTADSGYLTRRLIDVSHDVIVREEDCGCDHGFIVRAIYDKENKEIVSLADRLIGRYSARDIVDPQTGEVLVKGNTLIEEKDAKRVVAAGLKEVEIRSLFTCETKDGVCVHCYGKNLATGEMVQIGDAVGIMAAQSIGEPGTQLTMKNFHTGGVAGGDDITQGLPRVQELIEAREPKGVALITEIEGEVVSDTVSDATTNRHQITIKNDLEDKSYITNAGATIIVKVGDHVKNGQALTSGSIDPKALLEASDVETVENYLLNEVQRVYRSQSIGISDKHIEVIVRQMVRKIYIIDGGDTSLLPGSKVDVINFTDANEKVILEGKRPAVGRPVLLGITKAALDTNSFLSSASFQETTRVLTDAAVKGRIDYLHGLKENVMIGKLIPAGTGFEGETDDEYDNLTEFPQEEVEVNNDVVDEVVEEEEVIDSDDLANDDSISELTEEEIIASAKGL